MATDIIFPTAVRVIATGAAPQILQTVHQTIDWIQSLAEETQRKSCWRAALNDLYDADEVRDTRFLNKARSSLVQALREEGWL